jgi:hypothetical protein
VALAVPLGTNVLVNSDAEAGPGQPNGNSTGPIPGWQVTAGAPVALLWGAAGGFPDASTPGPSNRGSNFFGGGNSASASLTQVVDVSANAAQIDAGTIGYDLDGWLGGWSSQNDRAQLAVTFLGSTGNTLGSGQIGPVTNTDRGNATRFLERETTGAIPMGTRSIRAVLSFTRSAGTFDDGYADNLSLKLNPTTTSPNLIVNGDAELGDATLSGIDATTIPGWTVTIGTPTAAVWGASQGFPDASTPGPSNRGRSFFNGGVAETATTSMNQTVNVAAAATAIDGGGARYDLSGWLGGWSSQNDRAQVGITFQNATGSAIGTAQIGPVTNTDRGNTTQFLFREAQGSVPVGTRTILVVLTITLTGGSNADGYADNLSLTLSTPLAAPPAPTPPASTVPHYDHVFFTLMENRGLHDVMGASTWPYVNGLMSQYAQATNLYAVGHPSDPAYIALASGSTQGVYPNELPAKMGAIAAPHIGDALEGIGKTWKAYLETAPSACYKQNSGYYLTDDTPFLYFAQVANDTAYCNAHLPVIAQLATDLASTSTTPSLVWIAPDDCQDDEACGDSAGDNWLKGRLPSVFNSAAWQTQRSLLVITWDEDAHDEGNRIPTIVISSQGVKQGGFQSTTRYTLYSVLRTIEEALGAPPLTNNDRYAQPMNDFFTP